MLLNRREFFTSLACLAVASAVPLPIGVSEGIKADPSYIYLWGVQLEAYDNQTDVVLSWYLRDKQTSRWTRHTKRLPNRTLVATTTGIIQTGVELR